MSAGRRNFSRSLRRRVVGLLQVQRECNAIAVERLLAKPDRARQSRDGRARLEMGIENDLGHGQDAAGLQSIENLPQRRLAIRSRPEPSLARSGRTGRGRACPLPARPREIEYWRGLRPLLFPARAQASRPEYPWPRLRLAARLAWRSGWQADRDRSRHPTRPCPAAAPNARR